MIQSIHFQNFKAFDNYNIHLRDVNILTGPNNNGKSTILDALRLLKGAYGYASRLNPSFLSFPNGEKNFGYRIPKTSIPIDLENVQTNYNDGISKITFRFPEGKELILLFSDEHQMYLAFKTENKLPQTSSTFKNEFPLKIAIVPTLGPLEVREEKLSEDYVKYWSGSRRAPRMFRSYWFYNPENFQLFKNLVEQSWPGMSMNFPERRDPFSKELVMFCVENRILREVCWAGFGFQIWIQLLTHLIKNTDADILVVDEPEIYLHPDLQHKILDLFKNFTKRLILATHSVEMINNAEPNDVVIVDKNTKYAKRITDLVGLQAVSNLLGSGQNMQLTKLARGKKILFVEGQELKLLSRLSKLIGFGEVFANNEITVVPIEGFSNYERIMNANWVFGKILGEEILIAALFDSDYKCESEINDIRQKLECEVDLVHFLERKELENYFLIRSSLIRAILEKIKERSESPVVGLLVENEIHDVINEVSDRFKCIVSAQLTAHLLKPSRLKGRDIATVVKEFLISFERDWQSLEYRFKVIPGKQFFSSLNEALQRKFRISITYAQIMNCSRAEDVDIEIHSFFKKLNDFRLSKKNRKVDVSVGDIVS